MSFFGRALGIRADGSAENPAVPLGNWAVLFDALGFSRTDAGVVVNERTAMQLSAVYACVRVISETLASLPLNTYQRIDRGKTEARGNRVWPLLHDAPNPQMTAMVFRETMLAQTLLWGNGYAEISRDRAGRVIGFWPLRSEWTRPYRQNNQIVYRTQQEVGVPPDASSGPERQIAADDMLHVPGLGFDGIVGFSPIRMTSQTMGLTAAAEKFGALFFGNGSRPSGILTHPKVLRDDARKRLEESFRRATSRENANRAIVLEEDMKWTPMSIPPDDAQFLETRQFQTAEIARIFRVPLHLIQDLSRSTNNNIEQQSRDFVINCLRPWAVRFEQEFNRKLLGGPFFALHDFNELLRGDSQGRAVYYQTLRNTGVISANEIREKEGWNPVPEEEGGDVLLAPLNMTTLALLAKQEEEGEQESTAGDGTPDDVPDEPNGAVQRSRMLLAYGHLFMDGVGRALKREKRDAKAMRAIFSPAITAMAEGLIALEFPHPRALSGDAHSLIAGHAAAIAERAPAWASIDRAEIAKAEARRAYDALAARLEDLTEAIQ